MASLPAHRLLLGVGDESIRLRLAGLLRHDGYEVVIVGDGPALMDALGDSLDSAVSLPSFDLVLCDVRLIAESSWLASLTKKAASPGMPPVLLFTTRTSEEDDSVSHTSRILLLVSKPLDADDLRQAIERILG
jgi:DNA-binding response OmpR family regulator